MSHAATFDTLSYAKKLMAAGFTAQQAEVQAEALVEIIDERLATKQDIRDIEVKLKEMELRLKYELTLRFGVMLAAAVAVLAAIIKF